MWNQFNGLWASSTRCELAAAIVACMADTAVHIGSDSQAMIGRANAMKEQAGEVIRKISERHKDVHDADAREVLMRRDLEAAEERAPKQKPWLLQKDGDLWKLFWKICLHKTPRSIAFTKVKGHATLELVDSGRVTERDREGNNWSDIHANQGTKCVMGGLITVAGYYSKRQCKYVELAQKIIKTIVAVMQAVGKKLEDSKEEAKMLEQLGLKPTAYTATKLEYAPAHEATALQWTTIRRQQGESEDDYEYRRRVANFMHRVRWAAPEKGGNLLDRTIERQGTTWLELLAHFHQHGGSDRKPEYDRYLELCSRDQELNRAETKEADALRKHITKLDMGTAATMARFKKAARITAATTLPAHQAMYFHASKAANNRLAPLGISNKQPAIRANACVEDADAKGIAAAIIRQTGCKDTAKRQLHARGQMPIKLKTFREKGVLVWQHGMECGQDWTTKQLHSSDMETTKVRLGNIQCHRCRRWDDVRGRRMVKPNGRWTFIQCKGCRAMGCSKNWNCSCGVQWHQCDKHYHIDDNRRVSRQLNTKPKRGRDDVLPVRLRLSDDERRKLSDEERRKRLEDREIHARYYRTADRHIEMARRTKPPSTRQLRAKQPTRPQTAPDLVDEGPGDGMSEGQYHTDIPQSAPTCDDMKPDPPVGFCGRNVAAKTDQVDGNSNSQNSGNNSSGCHNRDADIDYTTMMPSNNETVYNGRKRRTHETQDGVSCTADSRPTPTGRTERSDRLHTRTTIRYINGKPHVQSMAGGWAEACAHKNCKHEVHTSCTACFPTYAYIITPQLPPHAMSTATIQNFAIVINAENIRQ